jgi:glycosyltransferase involved in cell wall biosynthesis
VDRPLEIVLLTLKFFPLLGGDVTHTRYLARFLSEKEFRTHILTIQPQDHVQDVSGENLEVHRLGFSATTTELETVGFKRFVYMISSFIFLIRLLSKHGVDLIHAHGWDPALVGGLFSRIFGVPLVLTVHGIPRPRDPILGMVFQFLEGGLLRLCSSKHSRIIALTNSDKSRLIELGVKEEAIDVIPNGVDVREFGRERSSKFRDRYGVSDEAFLVLFVGRLHEQKGVEVLLRAAERLKDVDVYFLVVGSGHKEREYKNLAQELQLKNVFFTGEIGREEVLVAFASSDVFVLPSIFEGMPYVVLEAMASGRPVVASNLPGLSEVIAEGGNGVLFDTGSDKDLAKAVLHLKENRSMTRSMGEASRRLAEDLFDWREVFGKTMDTYREILGETCIFEGLR